MNTAKPPAFLAPKKRHFRPWSLLIAIAGLLLCAIAAGALILTLRYDTLRIAVGPVGSSDHKFVEAVAEAFARQRRAVRLLPVRTETAAEGTQLLRGGKTDLAVVRSDELPPNAQAIAILRKDVLVLWAPQGRKSSRGKKAVSTKISSIDELEGRKVGLLGRAPANETLLKAVLSVSGVSPEKVSLVRFATSQIAEMAADQTLDAYATVGPTDSRITTEAIDATSRSRGEPKILAIDASEALAKKLPQYESAEIPPSSLGSSPPRPDDTVETIGLAHLIAARSSLSESVAATLARQLFTDRRALLRELPGAATLEKPDTDKDATIPVHPGAAAYFDGTERTFVEKYSDYFWGALLVLSGIGSASAWVRTFMKGDEKGQYNALQNRLLTLISLCSHERSVRELERVEEEAGSMLQDILGGYHNHAVEQGELIAFSLLLAQLRYVITERKRAIADNDN